MKDRSWVGHGLRMLNPTILMACQPVSRISRMDRNFSNSLAYLTSFLEHQGKDVGIHQALAPELGFPLRGTRPAGFTDAELVAKLRQAYENIGLEEFGNVALDWLGQ